MSWERPTLQQLLERISHDFSGRLLDGGAVLSRSVISVIAKVWAGACHLMHGLLDWLYRQVFADTAEGAYLERWARVWGMSRKTASWAAGTVIYTGQPGAVIPADTLLQNQSTGLRYAVLADGRIVYGAVSVDVEALDAGAGGNLAAGASLTLVAPIAGVTSEGTVDADGITGGAEEEDDEALRARFIARLREPPRGGSKSDFVSWALEVPGVTRAWCYPLGMGIGTVSLTFVTDDAADGPIPSAEMVARVQAHIEPLRPAALKEWLAFAPEPLPITVRLTVIPDTVAIRAAVRSELADLIAREGEPGVTLYRSHIDEAISLVPGEVDHILHEPEGNIDVPEGYFPLLDAILFEEAS